MKTASLHLYTADTPNGQKISIALEELGLDYRQTNVDLNKGEQKAPDFLALNPNGKIPVFVDEQEQVTLFESAVILTYLANRYGELGGQSAAENLLIQQWLCFQIASVGPMLGQLWWFRHGTTTRNEQALERYRRESLRLYTWLHRWRALHHCRHCSVHVAAHPRRTGLGHEPLPCCASVAEAWLEKIAKRPAVQRGLAKSRPEV